MEEGRNMKKIVLITGASSDIGSEIASLLGDSYEVILHYNNNYDEVMKLKNKWHQASWSSPFRSVRKSNSA